MSDRTCDVDALAAEWVVRGAGGGLTAEDQRELDGWLEADPRHLGAFIRARALWVDIDRVAALRSGARREQQAERSAGRAWLRAAAAAFMAVLMASGYLAYDRLPGRIATERGEIREVALEDGSTVTVNGNSVLQVRFDEGERHITLRRGEVSFRVARDIDRPFVVTAEDLTVTAVGTEFAVGLDGGRVAVTVAEGVVKLRSRGSVAEQQDQYLRRNEQFVAAETGARRAQLEPAEVSRRLAWRDGLLVFEGQPLGLAAREVNRHSGKPVVIEDPTLARAEFIGVFHVGDAESFAHAAAYAFNGRVVERDDAYYLMRIQNSPSH